MTGSTHSGFLTAIPVLLAAMLVLGPAGPCIAADAASGNGASITLLPVSDTYDIDEAKRGAVRFRASVRNSGPNTINIAHPSVCYPGYHKIGETKHIADHYGKSEILFKVIKPDGTSVVLRYRLPGGFDPGNFRMLTIPSNDTGTFDLGWFFWSAEARWEEIDEAATLFTKRGRYRITLLFRNHFPVALLYDMKTREIESVDVWTGEMESEQITVEIK
jgi:hypothetical protein